MNNEPSKPARPDVDAEQGSRESTTDSGAPIGEGSYEGTQRYAESIEGYLANADVAQDAADAASDSTEVADALALAEEQTAARTRASGK